MKKHKITIIFILSCLLHLNAPLDADEGTPPCLYRLEQGRIILCSGETAAIISINGKIEAACAGDNGLYYLTVREDLLGLSAHIGFIDFTTREISYEKKLPVSLADASTRKIMASGGIAYILAMPRSATGSEGVLYRVPVNTMETSERAGVIDCALAGADVILLARHESVYSVIMNDSVVPVSLKVNGPLSISEVLDARLVFIRCGDDTEVIDIRAGRSLYQYSTVREFLMPVDYNVAIDAADDGVSEQEERDMIFYKIFIDGIEAGRTESGPSRLPREFRINLGTDRYHLIRLERWLLKTGKGRYERENNIRQPKEQQIFIPMNRIVKLVVRYDGKSYRYDVAPAYRQ